MKVIMVMFDSLNRHMLPSYGCDWTVAPNFRRLAERTVQFNRSYVCSMPCMPARRDLHTGRPNFLHRSWGPLEPFDDSVPEILKKHGVYTHMVTDHYHYFEDGGATYHHRFSSWESFRGQEGDTWKGVVNPPDFDASRYTGRNASKDHWTMQDRTNRSYVLAEGDMPQAQTMAAGLEFIRTNAKADKWFLQIETFDPHEPFFSLRRYKDLYARHYDKYKAAGGKEYDWPFYRMNDRTPEETEHLRFEYAALLSMCDSYLGDVLDAMDAHNLWDDTMLIVCTDHGFLLGEHQCCAKMWMPFYEEVSHTPFWVWDPRCRKAGETREALIQPSIDIGPTLLEFFGVERTPRMRGKVLRDAIASDAAVRDAAIFGLHGGCVYVTDGTYVYQRSSAKGPGAEENQPLFDYTLMPTHMRSLFSVEELQDISLAEPFEFTRGVRTMKIPARKPLDTHPHITRHMLWNVKEDPTQERPIEDAKVEARLAAAMKRLMQEYEAPREQYERLGL